MAHYFLGIDVGSSKTHALIADEHGTAVGFGAAGAGNHETVGYDGFAAALQQSTQQALRQAGLSIDQIAGAGFGISGYDWPFEHEAMLGAIGTLGLSAPIELVNDTVIGLIAGATAGWGVAIVSGTGCNCWGRDQQYHIARLSGYGWMMGEGAGATELIEEAIRCVARHWSQRGPATQLSAAFTQAVGARNLDDLIEGLCRGTYQLKASAAKVVFEVAARGDRVANDLLDWAGRELASLAIGVIRQLHFDAIEFEIVLVGSLFDGGPRLIEPLQAAVREVAPYARFERLAAPPVVGAVLLGMEQVGEITPTTRATLIASTQHFLEQRRTSMMEEKR